MNHRICSSLALLLLAAAMMLSNVSAAQEPTPSDVTATADAPLAEATPASDAAPEKEDTNTADQATSTDAPPQPTPVAAAEPTTRSDSAAAEAATPTDKDSRIQLAALKEQGASYGTTWLDRLQSLFGIVVLLSLCWAMSSNRKNVPWRVVGWGIGLQVLLGVFVMKTTAGYWLFDRVNAVFVALMGFSEAGSSFIFGNLAKVNNVPVGPGGGMGPVGQTGQVAEVGAYFAFNVLPTIIFFSSLMAVLYHIGVMQFVVRGVAGLMQRTMGTSGSETLSASGNIFVGQTEAPLLVRPFVKGMTKSELMAVMTGGFATVAGGVMAAYISFLQGSFSDIAGHLLSASVMSAPAALVCAKLMVPEDHPEDSETYGTVNVEFEKIDANVIDAAARGAGDGMKLAFNVGAMLLAFIALIAMCNALIGLVHEDLTLQVILGYALAPLAWVMGVPWADAPQIGQLLGVKTVINEFVAYIELSNQLNAGTLTSPRSVVIATYALCGFANFGSIAIQIGGIGGIAPERRSDLAKLGLRAMIGGSIACMLTATVAGLLM